MGSYSLSKYLSENENRVNEACSVILKKRKKYSNYVKKCHKNDNIKDFSKLVSKNNEISEDDKKLVLCEYEKMKIWIKTLLSVYASIPNIIKIIDQIVSSHASNPYVTFGGNAFCDIEKVIDFCDRKNKLLNIQLMTNKLIDFSNDDEKRIIHFKFKDRATIETIAKFLMIEKRSVYRKIDSIIGKLATFALTQGWSTAFISNQVKNEPWIEERFNDYASEAQKRAKNNVSEREL